MARYYAGLDGVSWSRLAGREPPQIFGGQAGTPLCRVFGLRLCGGRKLLLTPVTVVAKANEESLLNALVARFSLHRATYLPSGSPLPFFLLLSPDANPLLFALLANRKHRHAAMPHDVLRDATEKDVRQSGAAMRAHLGADFCGDF